MTELSRRIKVLLHWRYFNQGYVMTNYLKYFIAYFGLASRDVNSTMILAVIYGFASYLVGWAWFRFKLADADAEIGNMFNPLAHELRGHMNGKGNKTFK